MVSSVRFTNIIAIKIKKLFEVERSACTLNDFSYKIKKSVRHQNNSFFALFYLELLIQNIQGWKKTDFKKIYVKVSCNIYKTARFVFMCNLLDIEGG